jgi:hypothetical protein
MKKGKNGEREKGRKEGKMTDGRKGGKKGERENGSKEVA